MKAEKAFSRMTGFASVELAIITPVFLGMLFGIIEFGVVLYDKAIITNASLQLAQAGATMTTTSKTSPPTQQVIDNVVQALTSTAALSSVIGTTLGDVSTGSAPSVIAAIDKLWDGLGYRLTVTVNYQYKGAVLVPVMKLLSGADLSNGIPLSTKTTVYLN